MLQRCHVCGKTGEDCKPCEHCGWWFCEKHIDPEQHECTDVRLFEKQAGVKPGEAGEVEQRQMWHRVRKASSSFERSPFLGLGLLFLALLVMLGARAVSYTGPQMEKELCRETLLLEPYSIKWFSVHVDLYYSSRIKNMSLRISASESALRKFSLMVYALKPEETESFLKWWAGINEHRVYEEPNFSKALHDASYVSKINATVPITISRSLDLYWIVLNSNPDKHVNVMIESSLTWFKPEQVILSYSLASPGLYAGLPLAILGAYFLVWRRRNPLEENPSHRTKILDSLAFSAILLLPFALYLSTEKDWNNSTVFLLNSYNPVNALSPEFLAVYALFLQSILLHEYGHFAAARAIGLKAEITGPKEPNVFAATRISGERLVTVREFLWIRRMGPVSNLLLVLIGIPLLILNQGTVFYGLVFLNLLLLSWNRKEFNMPVEEKAGEARRREIMRDERLFHNLAEKYVKTVESKLEVKLDYSLSSLRSLDTVARVLRHNVQDPAKLQRDFLAAYLLQTGSYLGETIIRSLNGKWVRVENPVGWAIGINSENIDVFQIALESIFMPNRFNELYEKLTAAGKHGDSSLGQEP